MSLALDIQDLVGYTAWQRAIWRTWFAQKGPAPLEVTTGDHGDGRFASIGGLIRHIFSSELRYAERIAGVPLTDTSVVAIDDPTALFLLGAFSRASFRGVIETLPTAHWTEPFELDLLGATARSTPRKLVLHVLTHEIRHWAQVTTLLRLQGWIGERQDLLFSPVLGDPIQLQNLP
jgi:uncharacterized damage-inducible protein DinB